MTASTCIRHGSAPGMVVRRNESAYGELVDRAYRVVSPHLDDVTLSCAFFVAANPGSIVTTVFAGGPSAVSPLTSWDMACRYFNDGDDVISQRRHEDEQSASLLGARTEQLAFWDAQYRYDHYGYNGPEGTALVADVTRELERVEAAHPVDAWLIPLGVCHDDHRVVAAACLDFVVAHGIDCYVYEELPYYKERATEVAAQVHRLESRGFLLVVDDSLRIPRDRSLNRAAVRCHRSQRAALGWRVRRAEYEEEHIWHLESA